MVESGRVVLLAVLLSLLTPVHPARGENFYARIRANDAPIGGRLSIFAYALDSLDVAVAAPGPGRVLAVNFREANGKDSFLIPGDLFVRGTQKREWSGGFLPLSEERLGGFFRKDDSRWALWWIPSDTLSWKSAAELTLHYGFSQSIFVPLEDKDAAATLRVLPWDRIRTKRILAERTTRDLTATPNPADYDQSPTIRTRKAPRYPKSARMYDFEGTVYVAVRIENDGSVTDAYVLQSDAAHQLNVSALVAVMDWVFRPGKKGGVSVGGEMVIPVEFTMGSAK